MTTNNHILEETQIALEESEHPAWDEPIICRVEVDLPAWLAQLTGANHWEVCSENEDESCISFTMQEKHRASKQSGRKQAEVTLYHNGYAVVDVDGESLFDGSLTTGTSDCAHLSYYHASGEQITLN